ncbi:hypothetical protein CASFOL_002478 [Castilleja foliolosa]|uniref:Subtilisin-like protease SBT5.3 n=1 Tax=Castilleja foliolosa TaxID=1961234 RepID=A0ABD3EER0_9LAMI
MKATIYYVSTLYDLSIIVIALLVLQPTFATKKSSYVVYMGTHTNRAQVTSADITQSHYDFLGSFLGSADKAKDAILYSYNKHINGFAAIIEDDVASKLSLLLSRRKKLHTTRSWNFLGLENNNGQSPVGSLWEKARFGEDVIIGNLDTGVWPESKSFSDVGMGPIPTKWKGICQNDHDPTFSCNRKLIGARYFNKGYISEAEPNSTTSNSPRDTDGHGTHTLSTAAGNFVGGANVFSFGNGTAKGGSPRARVAAYAVCWEWCSDADILAAFDMAIHDGVDVLSFSLGSLPYPLDDDLVAIGSFHAVMNGIVVVSSAGNSGPNSSTVVNIAPWQITVGASTMDRQFPSYVTLGNNMRLRGESLSDTSLQGKNLYPLISAGNAKAANATVEEAELCEPGTLDPKKVKVRILLCLRGDTDMVYKGEQALLAGAIGMVLVNDRASSGYDIRAEAHVLPATHISYMDGLALFSYINSTRSPMAFITRPTTELGTKPSPIMAPYSSVGPNSIIPEILKPDITAPGVSIIAAHTQAQGPTNEVFDSRRVEFNSLSGTSMSCPHIAGVVGLLKTLHPKWSPAAIKSAIMTTASTWDNTWNPITNASHFQATPFNYGGGHVQPNRAMDPGLVYDLSTNDYLDFLCALGYNQSLIELFSVNPYSCPKKSISLVNFNYPAITIPWLSSAINVTRKVKNVDKSSGTYRAFVRSPPGISIQIEPKMLKFKSVGEEKVFKVVIRANKIKGDKRGYVFGQLTWCDGKHYVASPIAVNMNITV